MPTIDNYKQNNGLIYNEHQIQFALVSPTKRGIYTGKFTTFDLVKVLCSAAVVLFIIIVLIFTWRKKIACFRYLRRRSVQRVEQQDIPVAGEALIFPYHQSTAFNDSLPGYHAVYNDRDNQFSNSFPIHPPSYHQATTLPINK